MASKEESEVTYTTNDNDLAEAAKLKERLAQSEGSSNNVGDKVPNVKIDEGRHKYVLISAVSSGKLEYFVTSKRGAHYHRNAAEPFVEELDRNGYKDIRIKGGGRIDFDDKSKEIHIYGYSYGFGQADHEISKKVVSSEYRFTNYKITWSNDGY